MLLVEDRITCPREADCSKPPPVNEEEQPRRWRPTVDGIIVHDPLRPDELDAGRGWDRPVVRGLRNWVNWGKPQSWTRLRILPAALTQEGVFCGRGRVDGVGLMEVVGPWERRAGRDRPSGLGATREPKDRTFPCPGLVPGRLFPLGRGLGAVRAVVEAHDWRICRLWKRPRVIHRARWWVYVVWKDSGWVGSSAGRSTKRRLGAKRTAQTYPPPWPMPKDRHCDMSEQPRRRASKRSSRRCDVVPQCLNINQSN